MTEAADLERLATQALAAIPGPLVLACDRPLAALTLRHERIKGLVSPDSPHGFSYRHWSLPRESGATTLLLLAPLQVLCFAMLAEAWKSGFRRIVWPVAGGWKSVRLTNLMLDQIIGKIQHLAGSWLMTQLIPIIRNGRLKTARRLVMSGLQRRLERALALAPAAAGQAGRILVVTPTLSTGGAERLVVSLLKALAPEGRDLHLFCQSLDPRQGHDFFLPEMTALRISPLRGEELIGCGGLLFQGSDDLTLSLLPARLREDVRLHLAAFRRIRPEAVYLWQDTTNIAGGIAALLAGVPRILLSTVSVAPVHFHHYLPIMGSIYRALATHPNVTLVNNSAMGAASYEGWLGLKPGSVRVLHNGQLDLREGCPPGAGTALRQSLGIAAEAPVIGAVQRMAPVKDPDLWLETARLVAETRPEVRFLLVGDGPSLPEMRQKAEAMGLSDAVIFAGSMNDPRLALDAMDVFLLTSHNEGLPNGLVEAQMMGVPVVAAKVGGVPEAVKDGQTGRLVASRDPQDFTAAVLAMLTDRPSAETCRAFVQSRFGMARMVSETLALLGYERP